MREWVEDRARASASHDVAVESTDGYVTLEVILADTVMSLTLTSRVSGSSQSPFEMCAKAMFVVDNPGGEKVGVRDGKTSFQ